MATGDRVVRIRRFLTMLAFAFWFGGLTFYAIVVIPTAHGVLRSHLRVGFITQQVTNWINVAATVMLLLLLWELCAGWRKRARPLRLASWVIVAAAQTALFALHPILDQLLDPGSREVTESDRFYGLHRMYLIVTTVQWAAALAHLWGYLGTAGAPGQDSSPEA